ncbi:signal peptidase I [Psychroserpens ponticola]|uniref:Signal peptidase I n=1 Tax=Psychroserpens ponticola TaxID=2932268 RepID=A0ABY7S011_9FLAO|nr:signal peptidase I [Psychroserpens ponticola]WCO02473.1 signal peptidase I [Psychroserpens ponticola]
MKKKLLYVLIGILILFGIARISGVIRFFDIASAGTEPNLKMNSNFIGTNLMSPKRLDFAYYNTYDEYFGNITIIQRIIALPNDVVQCKDGEFYVNGVNVDKTINLRRMYRFKSSDDISVIQKAALNDESILLFKEDEAYIHVTLDEDYASKLKLPFELLNSVEDLSNELKTENNPSWTINNFGPITIPEGKYLFVGDNRDNSLDSRYKGFVDEKNIKGTLLFQF